MFVYLVLSAACWSANERKVDFVANVIVVIQVVVIVAVVAAVVVTAAVAAFINGPGQKALPLRSQVESELSFYFSLPAKGKTQHICTHTLNTHTHQV